MRGVLSELEISASRPALVPPTVSGRSAEPAAPVAPVNWGPETPDCDETTVELDRFGHTRATGSSEESL